MSLIKNDSHYQILSETTFAAILDLVYAYSAGSDLYMKYTTEIPTVKYLHKLFQHFTNVCRLDRPLGT